MEILNWITISLIPAIAGSIIGIITHLKKNNKKIIELQNELEKKDEKIKKLEKENKTKDYEIFELKKEIEYLKNTKKDKTQIEIKEFKKGQN